MSFMLKLEGYNLCDDILDQSHSSNLIYGSLFWLENLATICGFLYFYVK